LTGPPWIGSADGFIWSAMMTRIFGRRVIGRVGSQSFFDAIVSDAPLLFVFVPIIMTGLYAK
jgi:hypothetical protein